jgi:hypothetical protein
MVLRGIRRAIWAVAWVTLLAYAAATRAALPHHTLYAASRTSGALTWLFLSIGCMSLNGILAWRAHAPLPGGLIQNHIYSILLVILSQGLYATQFLVTGDWGSFLLYGGIDLLWVWIMLGNLRRNFQHMWQATRISS